MFAVWRSWRSAGGLLRTCRPTPPDDVFRAPRPPRRQRTASRGAEAAEGASGCRTSGHSHRLTSGNALHNLVQRIAQPLQSSDTTGARAAASPQMTRYAACEQPRGRARADGRRATRRATHAGRAVRLALSCDGSAGLCWRSDLGAKSGRTAGTAGQWNAQLRDFRGGEKRGRTSDRARLLDVRRPKRAQSESRKSSTESASSACCLTAGAAADRFPYANRAARFCFCGASAKRLPSRRALTSVRSNGGGGGGQRRASCTRGERGRPTEGDAPATASAFSFSSFICAITSASPSPSSSALTGRAGIGRRIPPRPRPPPPSLADARRARSAWSTSSSSAELRPSFSSLDGRAGFDWCCSSTARAWASPDHARGERRRVGQLASQRKTRGQGLGRRTLVVRRRLDRALVVRVGLGLVVPVGVALELAAGEPGVDGCLVWPGASDRRLHCRVWRSAGASPSAYGPSSSATSKERASRTVRGRPSGRRQVRELLGLAVVIVAVLLLAAARPVLAAAALSDTRTRPGPTVASRPALLPLDRVAASSAARSGGRCRRVSLTSPRAAVTEEATSSELASPPKKEAIRGRTCSSAWTRAACACSGGPS